jgi:hypothetical protein
VEITSSHIYFLISYAVDFIVFGVIARLYLWPAMVTRDRKSALTPLLLYACLRVNGLMFIMPGLVASGLPAAFAYPVAYGDLTAVVLALAALTALRFELAIATVLVWIFNIAGTADLIYANIATFTAHVNPVTLGTAYYLAVVNVPAMLVVHGVIFMYLLRRSPA